MDVEVNGEVGSRVFVNGIDTNKVISSSGKVNITLDTSGSDGAKTFNISLKDALDNTSNALSYTLLKDTTAPTKPLLKNVKNYVNSDKFYIEVEGEVGAKIQINGVSSPITIPISGKVTNELDMNDGIHSGNQ